MAARLVAQGRQGAGPCLLERWIVMATGTANPKCFRQHQLGSCCEVLLKPPVPPWLVPLRLCDKSCAARTHDVAEEVHALFCQKGLDNIIELSAPSCEDFGRRGGAQVAENCLQQREISYPWWRARRPWHDVVAVSDVQARALESLRECRPK